MEESITVDIQHVSKVYNTYRREFDRFLEVVSPTRKSYHTPFAALKEVNLQVRKGECVGIIGTNGSGKSTLLKIITGVLSPTSGEVRVNGSISSLLELGAGFNPNYTGMQNIYLNGTIMGFSREEIPFRQNAHLKCSLFRQLFHSIRSKAALPSPQTEIRDPEYYS